MLDIFDIQGRILDPNHDTYYSNITGFIHGTSQFHNITPSALVENATAPWNGIAQAYMAETNNTEIIERIGSWNWTASDKLALSVVEKMPSQLNGTVISESIALVHVRSNPLLWLQYLLSN